MATIYEVARRAGVSIATVSRVQRGTAPVSDDARERVLRAIDELRYQPSPIGRSLAEGRHGASGIVFPDLSGPYYSEVIRGFEEQAAQAGQAVLILATHGRQQALTLVRDLAARVDGLVIMGRTVSDDVVRSLTSTGLPIVLLARPPAGDGADTVRAENVESATRLTTHLLAHGHRSIAFIGDPGSSPDASERWVGFVEAFRRAGLPAPDAPIRGSFREAGGYGGAAYALDSGPAPTALVCANDEMALGAYRACQERGLRIPHDIAVTGWDDIPAARFVAPSLTTVRQPLWDLGAFAARALLERVRGGRKSAVHEVLPTNLVVRASCGCGPDEGAEPPPYEPDGHVDR